MAKISIFLILLWVNNSLYAIANISNVRVWATPKTTRVVLDFDRNNNFEYNGFLLEDPARLVVDIKKADFADKNVLKNLNWGPLVSNIRYSNSNNNLRLVFDLNILNTKINHRIFNISPVDKLDKPRIVIDIKNEESTRIKKVASEIPLPKLTSINNYKKKKFTIMIDPGHGGDDPGAVGASGVQEKDVALAIAGYLKQYIDQDEDLTGFLTRSGDYYIGLRQRTEKARQQQADLFVSIHADGFHNSRASGSSVFVLSQRGASSELAKWLADSENASDLVGGVRLENKDAMLTTVLLDLSQTASNRASYQVADKVLQQMSIVTDLHKTRVEKAGFMVLRSPDIPSILVETGFISNPRGERNLSSTMHQRKLAHAIYKGIKSYFNMSPRPTWSDDLMQARK